MIFPQVSSHFALLYVSFTWCFRPLFSVGHDGAVCSCIKQPSLSSRAPGLKWLSGICVQLFCQLQQKVLSMAVQHSSNFRWTAC